MVVAHCPRCQVRIMSAYNNSDYQHNCRMGNTTIDEEDVLVLGNWSDYTGSDVNVPRIKSSTPGTENSLHGQRAWIEGGDEGDYSDRGKNTKLYRQRAHKEYIDLTKVKKK